MADNRLFIRQDGNRYHVETLIDGATRPIRYGTFISEEYAVRALPRYEAQCEQDHREAARLADSAVATKAMLREAVPSNGNDLFSRRKAFEAEIERMKREHGFKISPALSVMINRRYEQCIEVEPEGHGLPRLSADLEEWIVGALKIARDMPRKAQ